MPFVILLTASFQALAWKFHWERFILQIVPHYLVEGLLAGVGLKIAMKFVPFLYDIEHETNTWLNFEREVVLALSVISFVAFIFLYKSYQKKMPAIPYVIITITAVIIAFFFPLPKITIDDVPFQLALPLPHFSGLEPPEMLLMILKMVGYAMMLGTIDIIEQVMSNVAIEKMDPYKRKADSNNSLLAIWISNIGATFFGGMTNLDGLAKSTTNTVAGAVTKLSNVFTSLVLLIFVFFPELLSYLPEYALGIIMVYSGWKMIANIAHVRSEGRYALIMAGVCGVLVFEAGIFEGLLAVLALHAVIQFIFMKRMGKSNTEIWTIFKNSFSEDADKSLLERADIMSEPNVPILNKLEMTINNHDYKSLMKLYHNNAILIPAFSEKTIIGKANIGHFFRDYFDKDEVQLSIFQVSTKRVNDVKVDTGTYLLKWNNQGFPNQKQLRFSIVIKDGKIINHHSSAAPSFDDTQILPQAYALDYID
jgi:MFS superfamily sulfate permease-like transporter/ketosteroid isomerase-like protein